MGGKERVGGAEKSSNPVAGWHHEGEQQMNGRCLMRDKDSTRRGSNALVCVWIAVQGTDGRVRMEARWVLAGGVVTQPAA
jgi:hypothetical protein